MKIQNLLEFSSWAKKVSSFLKLKEKLRRHFSHYLRINILFILLAWSVSPSVWDLWSSVFFPFNCKISRFSGDTISSISIKREHMQQSLTSLRRKEWSLPGLLCGAKGKGAGGGRCEICAQLPAGIGHTGDFQCGVTGAGEVTSKGAQFHSLGQQSHFQPVQGGDFLSALWSVPLFAPLKPQVSPEHTLNPCVCRFCLWGLVW